MPVGGKSQSVNAHVIEYLDYYVKTPHEPEFAVLVTGAWGSGKTFLVKNFLKKHQAFNNKSKNNYIYVSLHGLSTVDDMYMEVLRAYSTFIASEKTQKAGTLFNKLLKSIKVDASVTGTQLAKFFDIYSKDLYVFDDLERCCLLDAGNGIAHLAGRPNHRLLVEFPSWRAGL
ncbi:MAG: KAP family NTPase [Alphaproteobacteria bacterium]